MKKISGFNRILLIIAIISMSIIFVGCNTQDNEDSSNEVLKIGISMPDVKEELHAKIHDLFVEECEARGIEYAIQVADIDSGKQNSQCENLISQGIDILVLFPVDRETSGTIVENAHDAGIDVLSFARLSEGNPDYYIGYDSIQCGEAQGEYLTSLVPKGNYIIMGGAPTDHNAYLFFEGAMKYIQPLIDKGDINVVAEQWVEDWQPSIALNIVENALTANENNVDAILAPNDQTAGGAIQALATQGMDGQVPVTGQDAELAAAQRIVEGTQSMTLYKDPLDLVVAAIDLSVDLNEGLDVKLETTTENETVEIPALLVPVKTIDKDNIDELLIDSGYLKKEDVYKNVNN